MEKNNIKGLICKRFIITVMGGFSLMKHNWEYIENLDYDLFYWVV